MVPPAHPQTFAEGTQAAGLAGDHPPVSPSACWPGQDARAALASGPQLKDYQQKRWVEGALEYDDDERGNIWVRDGSVKGEVGLPGHLRESRSIVRDPDRRRCNDLDT